MDIVLRCLNGTTTANHEGKRLGINPSRIYEWISLYQSLGEDGLITTSKNATYSAAQLWNWIRKYNGHEELETSGTEGTPIMTKGRKTTFEERVEIVQYCISHTHNYAETAEKNGISYQQVRNYTIKYEKDGIDALQDNRGKRKSYASLTEIERLRAELKLEKSKRQKAEMEVSFLKKLDEIERRRG